LFLPLKKRTVSNVALLPIGLIHPSPYQPRRCFDETELQGLAESIKRNGLLQPVAVRRRIDGTYELFSGERRLRASRLAGMSEIPCIIHDIDDRKCAMLGLIENLQRQDLNMFEEAEGIKRLMIDWGMSQCEVAQRVGKSQSTIANKLRLLRLTDEQQYRILAAHLTERHARALIRIESARCRDGVLNEIISRKMTAAEAEDYIYRVLNPQNEQLPNRHMPVIRDMRIYVNTLAKAVDTIRRSGLDARSAETETDEYIEYTVFIPKKAFK
jgi:ParB family chromosome partitioning protein